MNNNNSPLFNVVSTGSVVDGFDTLAVQQKLVSVMRLKPEQAQHFFDKRRVVKKGIPKPQAEKMQAGLAKLGVVTTIEAVVPKVVAPTETPKLEFEQDAAPASLALAIAPDDAYGSSAKTGAMRCPKCGHQQDQLEQCEQCGIWFHKFESTTTSSATHAPPAHAAPLTSTVQGSVKSEPVETVSASADGAFSPMAFAAAAGAALLGALVWKFVGVTFGYELGLVAWGVGGGIGFAAASCGSHGIRAGVICSLLVVASIAFGKIWTYSAFTSELEQVFSEMSVDDDAYYAYYEEETEDARLFAEGSGSDRFVRQFMVDRGYTDATDPTRVSDRELSEFREYSEPTLIEIAANEPGFEQWRQASIGSVADISSWEMLKDSFGFLDILFLGFGIATAFRLSSQMG